MAVHLVSELGVTGFPGVSVGELNTAPPNQHLGSVLDYWNQKDNSDVAGAN